ncbi:hypothetical protein QYF36_013737 [Acer negundo]|nr:hypothetical protein QYF36_013737 [Acer negundo]
MANQAARYPTTGSWSFDKYVQVESIPRPSSSHGESRCQRVFPDLVLLMANQSAKYLTTGSWSFDKLVLVDGISQPRQQECLMAIPGLEVIQLCPFGCPVYPKHVGKFLSPLPFFLLEFFLQEFLDGLVGSLHQSIGLRMGYRCKMEVDFPFLAKLSKLGIVELFAHISFAGHRGTELIYNVFFNEAGGVYLSYSGKGFCLHPPGKVVYCNHSMLGLTWSSWELPNEVKSPNGEKVLQLSGHYGFPRAGSGVAIVSRFRVILNSVMKSAKA